MQGESKWMEVGEDVGKKKCIDVDRGDMRECGANRKMAMDRNMWRAKKKEKLTPLE